MSAYAPRSFEYWGVSDLSGTQFKVYSIAAADREDIDIAAALDHAARMFAGSPAAEMTHRELGYIIYHTGEETNWLLIRTWLGGGIVSGVLTRVDHGPCVEVTAPLIECVWEEVVVHHERNAWVKHMMTEPEEPQKYLTDTLPDGMY